MNTIPENVPLNGSRDFTDDSAMNTSVLNSYNSTFQEESLIETPTLSRKASSLFSFDNTPLQPPDE